MPNADSECTECTFYTTEIVRLNTKLKAREEILAAMVVWLETNQPDVFRRGLWDAIRESKETV